MASLLDSVSPLCRRACRGWRRCDRSIDLTRDPLCIEVTGCTRDAEPEDDLAATGHGALDADGAIAGLCVESLAGIEADRGDGSSDLFAEVRIATRDDAREVVNLPDGRDD